MDKLFLSILNMSLTGAFIIAAICLARLPLKKAPKILSYGLWAVAGFRLVFPVSLESVWSFVPLQAQAIPLNIANQAAPGVQSGITAMDAAINSALPAAAPYASANPMQVLISIGAFIWLAGFVGLLLYAGVSYLILKHKMKGAALIEGNIFEADNIQSPFVLGILQPRIYLPAALPAGERGHILLHEQVHIKRRDHIVKCAAYLVLCLHWFNPLAWAAFLLMGVDMEMSCDERVLREMGGETKKAYSLSLLSLAEKRPLVRVSPLAFGEGGVKSRIKNVLRFQKSSKAVLIAAVLLIAALSVGCFTSRAAPLPANATIRPALVTAVTPPPRAALPLMPELSATPAIPPA